MEIGFVDCRFVKGIRSSPYFITEGPAMQNLKKIAAAALASFLATKAMAGYQIALVQAPAIGYHVIDSSLKLDNAGRVYGNADLPASAYETYFSEYGDVALLGKQLADGAYQTIDAVSGNGTLAGAAGPVNGVSIGFEQLGSEPTLLYGASGTDVAAFAVNDSGEAVGISANTSNESIHSTLLWQAGKTTAISVAVGNAPQIDTALAINDSGTVAGITTTRNSSLSTAFTWLNGKSTILPSLGGSSGVDDINSGGVVVGAGLDMSGERYAVEWSGGKIMKLLSGNGYEDSVAVAINDSGAVIGNDTTSTGVRGAFIYDDGQATSLDSLMPASDGYHFLEAFDINDNGQILAQATYDGSTEDVLLTPDVSDPSATIVAQIASVPEPSVTALLALIAGAGGLKRTTKK